MQIWFFNSCRSNETAQEDHYGSLKIADYEIPFWNKKRREDWIMPYVKISFGNLFRGEYTQQGV